MQFGEADDFPAAAAGEAVEMDPVSFDSSVRQSYHYPLNSISEWPQVHLVQHRPTNSSRRAKQKYSKQFAVVTMLKVLFRDGFHLIGCCSICCPHLHRFIETDLSDTALFGSLKETAASCTHITFVISWWYHQVYIEPNF